MKRIPFTKFHGTANDFIIINQLKEEWIDLDDHALIKRMCSRRFGIGADGLMVLEKGKGNIDFFMHYYNSDGSPSSMCGNGGRCISYAYVLSGSRLSAGQKAFKFGFNGDIYESHLLEDPEWISLKMQNLSHIQMIDDAYELDTGSPHFVQFFDEVDNLDVSREGAEIRYNDRYKKEGINVNFCSYRNDRLQVRTYERGVEDETYSCGTGVVASAISLAMKNNFSDGDHSIAIDTLGGELKVRITKQGSLFSDIYLQGPAVKVFEGFYEEVN